MDEDENENEMRKKKMNFLNFKIMCKAMIRMIRANLNVIIATIAIIAAIVFLDFCVNLIPLPISAGFASIFALILFVRDYLRIEPVIIQTDLIPVGVLYREVRTGIPTIRYCIVVELSNEGRRKAKKCKVLVIKNGATLVELQHIPINSPQGRPDDWPQYFEFPLSPRRPIKVRGYIKEKPDEQINVVLTMNGKPVPDQETGNFRLHDPSPESEIDLAMGRIPS